MSSVSATVKEIIASDPSLKNVDTEAIELALKDSINFVNKDNIDNKQSNYNYYTRLMALHYLEIRGFIKETTSESIGNVSASYSNNYTGKSKNPFYTKWRYEYDSYKSNLPIVLLE